MSSGCPLPLPSLSLLLHPSASPVSAFIVDEEAQQGQGAEGGLDREEA
jgi:hypothetical protein